MVGQRRYLPWVISTALAAAIAGGCSQPISGTVPTPDSGPPALAEVPRREATTLRLLYSRMPSTLNPHLATGVQDFEAGRIVLEPLATANERGELVPILAAEIPTVENEG
ncbi:MAG: peptide ABC transporter substrate-binding protein, partial [Cyanobacteria bacterium P01_E01_bin.48]